MNGNKKQVLVACEESQAVTKHLRAIGIEAFSCDILPCSGGHPEWHLQQDVREILHNNWDMILAFPPCNHLAISGARWFPQKQADGRQQQGIDFFMLFTDLDCQRIAIENPVGIMSNLYRKPDQYIQPYEFGFPGTKKTCLWLKGLPKLVPTNIVDKGEINQYSTGMKMTAWMDVLPFGGEERSIQRSKTLDCIAAAMAQQWGTLLLEDF